MKIMIMTKGNLCDSIYCHIKDRVSYIQSVYAINTSNIDSGLDKYIDLNIDVCDVVFVDAYSYIIATKYYYEANKDRSNIIPSLDPDLIISICNNIYNGKTIKRSMLDYIAELLKYFANNLVKGDNTSETSK